MRKIYFYLWSLLLMIGVTSAAQTTISSMSDFNNNTTYTIKSVNRGFLFYDASISSTNIASSSRTSTVNESPTGNIDATGEQFAFLRTNNTPAGKCYLYSVGAGKFVCRGTSNKADAYNLTLTNQVSTNCLVSYEAAGRGNTTGGKVLVLHEGNSKYIINITAYSSHSGIRVAHYDKTDGDDGNLMTITAVNMNASARLADALLAIKQLEAAPESEITAARGKLALAGKVGYPSTASTEYLELQALLDEGYPSSTELSTALANYYACTDVVLPEDGKAYTLTSKHMNGKYMYFYWNGSRVTTAERGENGTAELDMSAKFICRKVTSGNNATYTFTNNAGKYLAWFDNTTNNNTGYTDSYASRSPFQLIKFTKDAAGNHVLCSSNEDIFGYLGMMGKKSDLSNAYFILQPIANTLNCDALPYVDIEGTNNNTYRSSAIMFEETDYPNTPTLNATDLTDDGGNALRLATFSAPFPTILPEGVTAYYASSYTDGAVTLTEAASTAGACLPANQGFVLASTNAEMGSATMVPAASETAVTISDNKLGHSAGADKDLSTLGSDVAPFILTAVDGHVAFYALDDSDATLGMNKAYLALTSTGEGTLQTVKMDFGHTTTGITGATTNDLLTGKTYDLSGRVVTECSKAGIYIRNGRKFIVK